MHHDAEVSLPESGKKHVRSASTVAMFALAVGFSGPLYAFTGLKGLTVSLYGPTGGGNPIWKCADCGKAAAAMGPEVLCWCGYSHKHNHNATAYVCQPFTVLATKPELLAAFQACGCDPKRGGEVGIMLERDLHAAMRVAP